MSKDISSQKQVFFHPVESSDDMDKFFQSLIDKKILLQVKPKGLEDSKEGTLTALKVFSFKKTKLLTKHISGPSLSKEPITIVADLIDEKFFCTARVLEKKDRDYSINIDKLFRLQRRNNFRLTIPENLIQASVSVVKGDKIDPKDNFRLVDISAGGYAMAVSPKMINDFEMGALLTVSLHVGNHDELTLPVKIKYKRRHTSINGEDYIHFGCEFESISPAISQTLAHLVNDCHRQIFARLKG